MVSLIEISMGVTLFFVGITVLCIVGHYPASIETATGSSTEIAKMTGDCLSPTVGTGISLVVTIVIGLAQQDSRR